MSRSSFKSAASRLSFSKSFFGDRLRQLSSTFESGDSSSPVSGEHLHEQISAAKWCVTRQDLRHLRYEVKRAIREGNIVPTDQDQFDPADDTIGPNVYTVNEQFIKPRTSAAGKVSWALMRHPEGLQCDVFITHAWQEGIFEFLHKVLSSWPPGARHAWCCMLANPQNLDIARLIVSPGASPFAVALESARYVLVVPNSRCSVYTRLWCAYEAFLACERNKEILMAAAPIGRVTLKAVACTVIAAMAGAAGGVVFLACGVSWDSGILVTGVAQAMLFVLSLNLREPTLRRLCHWCGAAIGGYQTIRVSSGHVLYPGTDWPDWERPCLTAVSIVYFISAEADRCRLSTAGLEADQLREGYTGSIRDATCSKACDEVAIREEIGVNQEAIVDQCIHVLIQAGMSTDNLRCAAKAGVQIQMAAHSQCAFYHAAVCLYAVCMARVLFSMPHWAQLCYYQKWERILMLVNFGIFVTWLATSFYTSRDKWSFALRVMDKMLVAYTVVAFPLSLFVRDTQRAVSISIAVMLMMLLLSIALALLGVGRIAQLPLCGRALAQLLVMRGWAECWGRAASGEWPPLDAEDLDDEWLEETEHEDDTENSENEERTPVSVLTV